MEYMFWVLLTQPLMSLFKTTWGSSTVRAKTVYAFGCPPPPLGSAAAPDSVLPPLHRRGAKRGVVCHGNQQFHHLDFRRAPLPQGGFRPCRAVAEEAPDRECQTQ